MSELNLKAPLYSFTGEQFVELLNEVLTNWLNNQKPIVENFRTKKVSVNQLLLIYKGVLSRTSIHNFIYHGDMPHAKLGGKLVFDLEEVETWLKSKQAKSVMQLKAEADLHIAEHLTGKHK
jgi:predicted DNA-binding transcriptional regulator AlpA